MAAVIVPGPLDLLVMHTRLLIAIAVSGAVHAGAFVIGAGLYESYPSGREPHEATTTLTVSVVSPESDVAEAFRKETDANDREDNRESRPPMARQEVPARAHRAPTIHPETRHRASATRSVATPDANTVAPVEQDNLSPPEVPSTNENRRPEPPVEEQQQERASGTQLASASTRLSEAKHQAESEEQYLTEFLTELSKHKFYPRTARLSRQEGKVIVSLVLRRDGSIGDIHLAESSRFSVLDRAAVRAVQRLEKFKPFPPTMERTTWNLSVPFQYSITDR